MPDVVTIIGARPQFIKSAPVSKQFLSKGIDEFIIHTGQHYDANMSDIFFSQLGLRKPNARLNAGGLSHGAMTGMMLTEIEKLLLNEKPKIIIVYGDTNSTLAGALAASKLHIPVIHVEAGLRSYNRLMPEETNRVLTDHLSEILFCPTHQAVKNLAKENLTNNVYHVGDVMYDVLLKILMTNIGNTSILNDLGLLNKQYGVVTIHREENTQDIQHFKNLLSYLNNQSNTWPLIFPAHPRARTLIEDNNIELKNIKLISPLSYINMALLLNRSSIIYTDSGGIQKEAYFHKVPCVTLRAETEWVETIEKGWNRLWTVDHYNPRSDIDEFGTGNAASKITTIIHPLLQ